MVPKDVEGKFKASFSDIEWGNGYTEGNAWHHSFPPFAIAQLTKLHGGAAALLKKLAHMISMPSNFQTGTLMEVLWNVICLMLFIGSYNQEIHEMTEGRALALGQYAHNNQPSHHILYLFALLGDRRSTEKYVRIVLDRAYGRDFFAGDEDNGEQGAWYVMSALGLFSVAPGSPDYVLGTPIFKHVKIQYGRSRPPLHIIARGTSSDVLHVQSVYFNGQKVAASTISDALVQNGGVLQFVMEREEEILLSPQEAERLYVPVIGPHILASVNQSSEVAELEEELENLRAKEEELRHQVHYLEHKLNPAFEIPDERTISRNASSDNYLLKGLALILLTAIGAVIGVRHLQALKGSSKFTKHDTHNV